MQEVRVAVLHFPICLETQELRAAISSQLPQASGPMTQLRKITMSISKFRQVRGRLLSYLEQCYIQLDETPCGKVNGDSIVSSENSLGAVSILDNAEQLEYLQNSTQWNKASPELDGDDFERHHTQHFKDVVIVSAEILEDIVWLGEKDTSAVEGEEKGPEDEVDYEHQVDEPATHKQRHVDLEELWVQADRKKVRDCDGIEDKTEEYEQVPRVAEGRFWLEHIHTPGLCFHLKYCCDESCISYVEIWQNGHVEVLMIDD
jgi:hypothetical protein